MKILILVAGFPPAYLAGGPIRSITAMLKNADSRHRVFVLTNNYDLGSEEPLVADTRIWHKWQSSSVRYLAKGVRGTFVGLGTMRNVKPDVIYLNSFFSLRMSIVFQVLGKLINRSTLVIAPRGELDPGALRQKSFKKQIYLSIARLLGITRNCIWHASSELELSNIEHAVGHKVKVVIRENDTLLPNRSQPPRKSTTTLKVASLSRISPKKNIHVLLAALKSVKEPMRLDILGPAEDLSYFNKCQKIAETLPENIEVHFVGNIDSDSVVDRLNEYDMMLCPTLAENFGHVIAESLAASCPVMCADVTPWTKVLEAGGGVVVRKHDPSGWADCINNYAISGPETWYENRIKAANSYSLWRDSNREPHFFELLDLHIS